MVNMFNLRPSSWNIFPKIHGISTVENFYHTNKNIGTWNSDMAEQQNRQGMTAELEGY